ADRELSRVAGNHAVDEFHRILAGDQVLEQRRDVDERRSVSYRVVLVFVVRLVRAHRVVAGPLAIVEALAQPECAVVDGGPDRHAAYYKYRYDSTAVLSVAGRCDRCL